MTSFVEQLNLILSLGIIALQMSACFVFLLFLFKKKHPVLRLIRKYGLLIVFALSLLGAVMTLVYSEVFGFVPCSLCWLQRVFLYSQVVVVGIALVKREQVAMVADYLIGLSVFGAVVALYQHLLQVGERDLVGCPVSGGDCSQRILFEFGYITFPLMAFTLFAAITVFMLAARRVRTS
ncbi:MAG: disulfide bond formation protein B [Candidatus Pacebacteria bacterium]|nr:disulfide bond formation protein B [Candidatus Paceibacterota bacterium]